MTSRDKSDKVLSQYVVNPNTKYALSLVWKDLIKKYPLYAPTEIYLGTKLKIKYEGKKK